MCRIPCRSYTYLYIRSTAVRNSYAASGFEQHDTRGCTSLLITGRQATGVEAPASMEANPLVAVPQAPAVGRTLGNIPRTQDVCVLVRICIRACCAFAHKAVVQSTNSQDERKLSPTGSSLGRASLPCCMCECRENPRRGYTDEIQGTKRGAWF